jgi:hypothetical protein
MAEALCRWMEQPKDKQMTPLDLVGLLADAEWEDASRSDSPPAYGTRASAKRPASRTSTTSICAAWRRRCCWSLPRAAGSPRTRTWSSPVTPVSEESYLACALGQKACRDGHTVVYRRTSRLLDELAQARADGSHFNLLRRLAKTEVLILDDFGLEVLNAAQRKDLLEVLEDRYGVSSTNVTSQL